MAGPASNETTTFTQFDGALGASFTGAVKPVRFLGGVSGAAPSATSVVYQVGDFVVDQLGSFWICTVSGTPGTWVTLSASQTSALGDLTYGGTAGAATRLARQTTTQVEFLSQTGTGSASAAPAWATVSGQMLVAPHIYAPGSPATPNVTSSTLAAFDSTNITTGAFLAPLSGTVIVRVSFAGTPTATTVTSFALGAHGTVTPVVGHVISTEQTAVTAIQFYNLEFAVTSLVPGTSTQYDLLGAVAATGFTINASGVTSVTPTGAAGAPVTLSVFGV